MYTQIRSKIWAIAPFIFMVPTAFCADLVIEVGDVVGGKTLATVGVPNINDSGVVVFKAFHSTGGVNRGIFTQNRVVALNLDPAPGTGGKVFVDLFSFPTINSFGQVGFLAAFGPGVGFPSDGRGIFVDNTAAALPGRRIGGISISARMGDGSAINDFGTVAFRARFGCSGFRCSGDGIFTQSSLIARNGSVIGGKSLIGFEGLVAINNAGSVAFRATFSGGSGIFTQSGPVALSGDIIDGITLIAVSGPASINNSGDVVYRGFGSGFEFGVFLNNSSAVALLGDTIDGVTITGAGPPVINDSGQIAFQAPFSSGSGIFSSGKLLVKVGDTIDGRTLTNINQLISINNNGEIAFFGRFSGGHGIFVVQGIVEAIQNLIDDLQGIVDSNPGTELAEELADAIDELEHALEELAEMPPDNKHALRGMEDAVEEIEDAIDKGLNPAQGTQLMDQLAGVARLLAADAVDQAIARGGDSSNIADAQQALGQGDTLRASGAFKDAIREYGDALSQAEDA